MNNYTCFSEMIPKKPKQTSRLRQQCVVATDRSLRDLMQAYEIFPHGNYTLNYGRALQNKAVERKDPSPQFQAGINPLEQWVSNQGKIKRNSTSRRKKPFQSNKENEIDNTEEYSKYVQQNSMTYGMNKRVKTKESQQKISNKKSPTKNIRQLCENYVSQKGEQNQDGLVWKFRSKQIQAQQNFSLNSKEKTKKSSQIVLWGEQSVENQKCLLSPSAYQKPIQKKQQEQVEGQSELNILGSVERQVACRVSLKKLQNCSKNSLQKPEPRQNQHKKHQIIGTHLSQGIIIAAEDNLNLNFNNSFQNRPKNNISFRQVAQSQRSIPKTLISISKLALSITDEQAQNEAETSQSFAQSTTGTKFNKITFNSNKEVVQENQMSGSSTQNYNKNGQQNLLKDDKNPSIEQKLKILSSFGEKQDRIIIDRILKSPQNQEQKKLKITISPNYKKANIQSQNEVSINGFHEKDSIKNSYKNNINQSKSSYQQDKNQVPHNPVQESIKMSNKAAAQSFKFDLDF